VFDVRFVWFIVCLLLEDAFGMGGLVELSVLLLLLLQALVHEQAWHDSVTFCVALSIGMLRLVPLNAWEDALLWGT